MEVILLRFHLFHLKNQINRFNPCFYGSYSFTDYFKSDVIAVTIRFNPCFYGSYSFTRLAGAPISKVETF